MSSDEHLSQASSNPEFITLDEAAVVTTGTRVTFIPGIPAMYSEALSGAIRTHQPDKFADDAA